ncbi:UNVERIFIED_ORG: spore coat-associated protein N [Arthrobacter sp. UYCu721]
MGISMKTTSGKVLASVALVGTAAAVAGMGTYGAFSSTTSASQAVTSGTVVIGLGNVNNTLSVPVAGLLPGDTVDKFVTLENTGNSTLGTVTLSTAAATGTESLLTSDVVNGLKITVESCTSAWTGTAGAYTCPAPATKSTPLASSPVIGSRVLPGLSSMVATKSDFLKITTALPKEADNTFQAKSSTIGFTFTATQRTETAK